MTKVPDVVETHSIASQVTVEVGTGVSVTDGPGTEESPNPVRRKRF